MLTTHAILVLLLSAGLTYVLTPLAIVLGRGWNLVDVPGGRSGLRRLETILGGIDGLAFVRLTGADVVRHKIVQDIVDAYDRHDAAKGAEQG